MIPVVGMWFPLFSPCPESAQTEWSYLSPTEEQEATFYPPLPVQGLYPFLTSFGNLGSALGWNNINKREISLEMCRPFSLTVLFLK